MRMVSSTPQRQGLWKKSFPPCTSRLNDLNELKNNAILQCSSCGNLFEKWRNNSARCRDCYNKYAREWAQRNKHRVKKQVLRRWKSYSRKARYERYGLTEEQYTALITSQPNCAICEKSFETERRNIDHCHTTGRVRGLLCPGCNRGLGFFGDSPERLIKAAQYLKDTQF
jgi:predicted amidophosphoribosyltransferase